MTTPDHAARIAEIRRQLEAATPGPWKWSPRWAGAWCTFNGLYGLEPDGTYSREVVGPEVQADDDCNQSVAIIVEREDADLIENAPTHIQYLLNRVAELERGVRERDRLTAELARRDAERTEAESLAEYTYWVQHNPRCPSKYLVRLVGRGAGRIDGLPHKQTKDILGYGTTFNQAAIAALEAAAGETNHAD